MLFLLGTRLPVVLVTCALDEVKVDDDDDDYDEEDGNVDDDKDVALTQYTL